MTSEPRAPDGGPADGADGAGGMGAPGRVDAARTDDGTDGAPVPEVDERRLHPAWVLTRALAVLRGLVPAFVGLAVGLREWAVPAALALSAIVVGLRTVEWWATRYAVVDGTLRVRSGVLARRERVVPASRISALDTSRGLVQRLFGLVALEVQTAGGGKAAELRLDALTTEEAERLRAALGHAGAGGPGSDEPLDVAGPGDHDGRPGHGGPPEGLAPHRPGPFAPSPEPVYAITPRQLVTAALTGPQLGLVAVIVGSVLSQGRDLLPRGITDRAEDELSAASATTVVVVVLVGLLLAAAISVAGTVLAFAEFSVVRDDRRLRVRRGLLTERTGTIPLDRIHGVRVVEGLLRRPLGYATVQVEVAGYRGDSDLTRTLVPLVHRSELPDLLARMLPELPWTDEPLQRPPRRARRRYWTVPVLASLVPTGVLLLALPGSWAGVALLAPLAGLLLGESRWRGAGWALGTSTLTVRTQLVARTTLLVLAPRIQRAQHRTQPLQRRAGLATFAVALATGRTGELRHLDDAVAGDLQRAVVARTARPTSPAVRRDGSLSSVAPPE